MVVDLVKISFVAAGVVLLIRRKIGFGVTLLLGAAALGLLFFGGTPVHRLMSTFDSFAGGALAAKTLTLLAILVLVLILGSVFQHTGNADRMTDGLSRLIPDYRVSAILPAMLIGFLPMLGGAMLSAPMVKRFADRMRLSPEQATFANYWFRHVWEFSWPLYVGLLLAADILNVPLRLIILRLLPLTFSAILFGWLLQLRHYPSGMEPAVRSGLPGSGADDDYASIENPGGAGIPDTEKQDRTVGYTPGWTSSTNLRDAEVQAAPPKTRLDEILNVILLSWPILAVIVLFLVFDLPLLPVLFAVVAVDLALAKPSRSDLARILKSGFELRILMVGLGVMVFAKVLQDTDALSLVGELNSSFPMLSWPIVFMVPFSVAFATGVNHTFVGIGFPLILPLLGTGDETSYSMIVLAFAGGFTGVMLSPFHLCLALTREYYGARWDGLYRLLLPPSAFVAASAVLLALFYSMQPA